MTIADNIKHAFDFMMKPPEPSAQLQTVQATAERVIKASHELAQKQDILGNLVKQVKGPRTAKRSRG